MEAHSNEQQEHGPEVTITVNDTDHLIHRGRQTVTAIKVAGQVPLADDLVEVVDKKPVELPDDGSAVIKGGEKFISHPKGSGSA